MAKSETNIQKEIMMALSKIGATVFRNNVAKAWVGKYERGQDIDVYVSRSDVILRCARPLEAGLCVGSSDLIGWKPVVITPEMVGKTIAVFIAPEVKTKKGRKRTSQELFIDAVNKDGGIAGFVRSPEEAIKLALDT